MRPVALEALPLAKQLDLIASADGIVSVHGQALAFIPFLGAARNRSSVLGSASRVDDTAVPLGFGGYAFAAGASTAVLEILPPPVKTHIDQRNPSQRVPVKPPFYHIYGQLSQALGVHHLQIVDGVSLAQPCTLKRLQRLRDSRAPLRCNVSVSPTRFAMGVDAMRTLLRRPQ